MRPSVHPITPLGRLLGLLLCGASVACAWEASGVVKDKNGPLAGVTIAANDPAVKSVVSDAAGAFSLAMTGLAPKGDLANFSVRREGEEIIVRCGGEGDLEAAVMDAAGAVGWRTTARLVDGTARFRMESGVRAGFLRVRRGAEAWYVPLFSNGANWNIASHLVQGRSLATVATLTFKKAGYRDTSIVLTAESTKGMTVVMGDTGKVVTPVDTDWVEDHRSECTMPSFPAVSALKSASTLPDPFKMFDGTAITSKAQAKCKREEVLAMMEKYVMGEKPRKPEKVEGSFSGGKLTVKVTDKGKSVSFQVSISKPSGNGPFAALIGLEGGNIGGSFSGLPVATISYPAMTTIATEGSGRGKGVFYDLYGSNAAAGELMAWAWGVSRVIDALATTPAAGIDPKKLAVTGCSRLGKGAFVVGVMDQRIALVIPQESGTGGLASWRMVASDSKAQPPANAAGEQYWMRADFSSNFGNATGKLPFDNHEIAGWLAPRAFLFFDNSIDWLGPTGGYGTATAAKEVYKAMGVPEAFTYSSVGGHDHCSLPATQNHWVQSYMKKYLLGQTGEADKIEGPYSFDKAKWINWTTPTLK